ncbi:hypothetical protein CXF74_10005 [Psychromonas sp. Urea-02u-13]|nr:hypothetical protein CXF74_10005 [Psychromonas sp. Urea-02u-13]
MLLRERPSRYFLDTSEGNDGKFSFLKVEKAQLVEQGFDVSVSQLILKIVRSPLRITMKK